VSPCRAARVEQQVVKIPEHEVVVALDRPQVAIEGSIDLEKDLAIHQQGEKPDSGKSFLAPQLSDWMWLGQRGDYGRDLGMTNLKQRASARRLQDHLVAATPHVGKPRQNENVGVAEFLLLRPVVRNLRFDDGLLLVVLLRARDAVHEEAVAGQPPDQKIKLFVRGPAARRERHERQTRLKVARAIRHPGAERPKADRMSLETGNDLAVRLRFQRNWTVEQGGNGC
jgi:hypothetical protein